MNLLLLLVWLIGFLLTLAGSWVWDQKDRLLEDHRPIRTSEWIWFSSLWYITVPWHLLSTGWDAIQPFLDKQILFKPKSE